MSPCTDVGAEGYVIDDTSFALEPIEDTLPFGRENRFYGRRCKNDDLFLRHSLHTFLGIVNIVSCPVRTALYTFTANYALFRINGSDKSSVIKHFGDIGLGSRTRSDTGIAADTFFGFNNNDLACTDLKQLSFK